MIFGLSVASSNRGFMGGASSQAPESAARSSPGGGLGNERQGHAAWLAAAQSPPRALLSSLRNSHAISRRRAIGYALDQRFACSLRPIFCAFAPFAATRASAARPPRAQERAARTHRGIRSQARPASLLARVSRTRIKLRAILNSYAPIIMRSPHPPF
jgi:hypothetical protein